MLRQGRAFSPEFKLRVVQEVESGQSQASVARKYDLSPHLIPLCWRKAFQTGRLGGEATGDPSVQELLLDQQIKAEIIQEQTQQIHLLKKALASLSPRSPSASSSSAPNGKNSRSRKPVP
jgi:transposase-like protein